MGPSLIRVSEGNVFLAWGHCGLMRTRGDGEAWPNKLTRKRRKWARNGRKLRWRWRGVLRTEQLMSGVY